MPSYRPVSSREKLGRNALASLKELGGILKTGSGMNARALSMVFSMYVLNIRALGVCTLDVRTLMMIPTIFMGLWVSGSIPDGVVMMAS